jgi:hypothetical protein
VAGFIDCAERAQIRGVYAGIGPPTAALCLDLETETVSASGLHEARPHLSCWLLLDLSC